VTIEVERFLQQYPDEVVGVLSGLDRVVYRGTFRSLSYVEGMSKFLSCERVLLKDFGRFAESCTQQLKRGVEQLADDAGLEVHYIASAGVSKEQRALEIGSQNGVQEGLMAVLSCVEPCMTFDVYRNAETKKLELVKRERKCLFYYFYYRHKEFGLMHVRLQSWLPFDVQICLNGRSYLAEQMNRAGISFEQRDNCFARIENLPRAQRMLDALAGKPWAKLLERLSWQVNRLLRRVLRGQRYYWTTRQAEIATDVMFRDEAALNAVYPALVEYAVHCFSSRDVMRFLGRQTNSRFGGDVVTRVVWDQDGVRIKHSIEENSIKMYNKQGVVLRIETTINNPRRFRVWRASEGGDQRQRKWQRMRKGVADFWRLVQVAMASNGRYLEGLSVVGRTTPSHQVLDPVSERVKKDGQAYRALRPVSVPDAALFEAVLQGEHAAVGFRNGDVQERLFSQPAGNAKEQKRRSAYVSRQLRLLRAHGLIRKVSGQRLYRTTLKGHEVMGTALAFRSPQVALLRRNAA
jgi:hypothetical protein